VSDRPTYSASQFLHAAQVQRHELTTAIAETERLRAGHDRCRADLASRCGHAMEELVNALLPDLSAEALTRAVWCTGYSKLAPAGVHASIAAERQTLGARLGQIQDDPRFRDRELLRAPRVGSLTRAIEELLQFRGPLVDFLTQCEHPRLERLLEGGYGTPEYGTPFWRVSFYGDWKAADAIVERFGKEKTFLQLREEILRDREAVAVYDARLAELRAEWAAGQALDDELETKRQALSTLDARWLTQARQALARHLADLDLSTIGTRLAQYADVDIFGKRYWGLRQQLLYLDRLTEKHLDAPAADLRAAITKLDRDVTKYSRPKNQWAVIPGDVFERRFQSRAPRFQKNWQRYQHSYTSVYAFHTYDRGSLASDFLWWDLMTDGRADGDFMPEVQRFRQHNPGYQYQRPADDDDPVGGLDDAADIDAAAAVAGTDGGLDGTGGSGAMLDVS
jgi:hypothetical protein